ncbi:MAG: hypothetical protein IKF82_07700 [Bacilli bacterium]|nr:hypothetical protein [Bacilli bacterium]
MKQINSNKIIKYIPWITTIIIFTITLGFASLTSASSIIANAKVDPYIGIQIIKVSEYSNANNGSSTYETNTIDKITSGAYLPNNNSEITYQIDLANLGTTENGNGSSSTPYRISLIS